MLTYISYPNLVFVFSKFGGYRYPFKQITIVIMKEIIKEIIKEVVIVKMSG